VVYYHQEHACNGSFDGVGEFLKTDVTRRPLPIFSLFGALEVPKSYLVSPK